MSELHAREVWPTISGPGAFLVALTFLALIMSSEESRRLALDWQFAVALVAISFSASVFVIQIFGAINTLRGYRRKAKFWGEGYAEFEKYMHRLDSMLDYSCLTKDKEAEYRYVTRVIERDRWEYNLFAILRWCSILFLVVYFVMLPTYISVGAISLFVPGIILVCAVGVACVVLFYLASEESWQTYMTLERRVVQELKSTLIPWAKTQKQEYWEKESIPETR